MPGCYFEEMFSTAVTEETDTTTTTMRNSTTNATYNVTTNVTYNVSLTPHRAPTPDPQRVPGRHCSAAHTPGPRLGQVTTEADTNQLLMYSWGWSMMQRFLINEPILIFFSVSSKQ